MNNKIETFDINTVEYDDWFETNEFAYQSELEAVKNFIPKHRLGVDIGCGTGRFLVPFSVTIGVEPSRAMAMIADSRGMIVHNCIAEELPFCKDCFDFVLLITTLCFVDEACGNLITGIIDRTSELGKVYNSIKKENKFYRNANFYSVDEAVNLLNTNAFKTDKIYQTIFFQTRKQ